MSVFRPLPGADVLAECLCLDVKPHPDGIPVERVDITRYEEVHEAAQGMDAIVNFTVVRHDPVLNFHVNTRGTWHVMKAAAAHGIREGVRWTDRWGLFHICAPVPNGKFLIDAARRMGYEPKHDFARWYER